MKNIVVFLFCILIQNAFAQSPKTGYIEGKVVEGTVKDFIEGTTGEIIPGAKIIIDGTEYRAISDFDGNYFIRGIEFGTYSITISSPGHVTKILTDVVVSSSDVQLINISLEPISTTISEVVVKVKINKSDDIGMEKIFYFIKTILTIMKIIFFQLYLQFLGYQIFITLIMQTSFILTKK